MIAFRMATPIGITEVARHLGDHFARAIHKGERFALTKKEVRAIATEWIFKANHFDRHNLVEVACAHMLGVSLGKVRKWERRTIQPSRAAGKLPGIAGKKSAIAREANNI